MTKTPATKTPDEVSNDLSTAVSRLGVDLTRARTIVGLLHEMHEETTVPTTAIDREYFDRVAAGLAMLGPWLAAQVAAAEAIEVALNRVEAIR